MEQDPTTILNQIIKTVSNNVTGIIVIGLLIFIFCKAIGK